MGKKSDNEDANEALTAQSVQNTVMSVQYYADYKAAQAETARLIKENLGSNATEALKKAQTASGQLSAEQAMQGSQTTANATNQAARMAGTSQSLAGIQGALAGATSANDIYQRQVNQNVGNYLNANSASIGTALQQQSMGMSGQQGSAGTAAGLSGASAQAIAAEGERQAALWGAGISATGEVAGSLLGGGGGGGGSGSVGVSSDENLKDSAKVDPVTAYANIDAYQFRYKPEAQEKLGLDNDIHLGVMAQDIETIPGLESAVTSDKEGNKMVNPQLMAMANTATISELAKRVLNLEKMGATNGK